MKYIGFIIGLFVWIGISLISGRTEAWDSSLYGIVGLPVMGLAALVMGYMQPDMARRNALWISAGQGIGILSGGMIHDASFGLFPLTIIAILIFSLPMMLMAMIGALAGRKWRRR